MFETSERKIYVVDIKKYRENKLELNWGL